MYLDKSFIFIIYPVGDSSGHVGWCILGVLVTDTAVTCEYMGTLERTRKKSEQGVLMRRPWAAKSFRSKEARHVRSRGPGEVRRIMRYDNPHLRSAVPSI